MMMRILLLAGLNLCLVRGGSAQGGPQKTGSASASPASTPEDMTPAKPHPQITRLLQALGGTWSIKEELAPDASSPNGKTGAGTIVWRPGPGGYSVVEEYRSKQGKESISGLGELWWDDAAGGYHTIWCDSTNPGGCIDFKDQARWEGEKLVLQEDYEVNGKKFTFREEFGDIGPDHFTQTLYGGHPGGPLKVDQTIHATRAKGPSR
jgi:hypothetical protein